MENLEMPSILKALSPEVLEFQTHPEQKRSAKTRSSDLDRAMSRQKWSYMYNIYRWLYKSFHTVYVTCTLCLFNICNCGKWPIYRWFMNIYLLRIVVLPYEKATLNYQRAFINSIFAVHFFNLVWRDCLKGSPAGCQKLHAAWQRIWVLRNMGPISYVMWTLVYKPHWL